MKQSDNISGLLKALCAAQAEFPTMPKDSSGYGYKYTNLDTIVLTIKPILAKHNLGYIQPITTAFLENQKPCSTNNNPLTNFQNDNLSKNYKDILINYFIQKHKLIILNNFFNLKINKNNY